MRNDTVCSIRFDFSETFLPPVFILVFIVGLLANGWGLKFLWQNWEKMRNINIFILNLGIADVFYLLTLPFLVVYYSWRKKWIFGQVFCKITRFFFNLNIYTNIGFLTCISVYRYLAIVHPVRWRGRITATHTVIITAVVWFSVCVQCLPDTFFPKTFGNTTERCFDTTSEVYYEDYLKYSLGWTLTGVCLPFLIILGCYGHMIFVICTETRITKAMKQGSFRLLFILILLFSFCYIPYHVLKNLDLQARVLLKQRVCREWFNQVYIARQISRGFLCLNSVLNPLVYLHGNGGQWNQLRGGLHRARQGLRNLRVNYQRPRQTSTVVNSPKLIDVENKRTTFDLKSHF